MKSPYREDFKIRGFRFGEGEKTLAIVGAMRGDEVQQLFTCSQIVKNLIDFVNAGKLIPGHEILVIPSANHFSMNISKRFWAMDNTDINRMFPGYDKGETTQRIASAIFEHLKGYRYGIQMASFYMPGEFIPHVRMMNTGFQNITLAKKFGLPYILIRQPKPYDTTVLNYNWQIFDTQAFSVYSGYTDIINKDAAKMAWLSVFRFMQKTKLLNLDMHDGYSSCVVKENELQVVKADQSGVLYVLSNPGDEIKTGDLLAKILDPFTGDTKSSILSPCNGTIFFVHHKPLISQNTIMFKIINLKD